MRHFAATRRGFHGTRSFRFRHLRLQNRCESVANVSSSWRGCQEVWGWSYAYDGLGRLLSATGSLGTRTYAYDTFGNLTSLGGTAVPVDHGTNHLLAGAVYDARGNMTDQPMGTWTRRLRWDEENRLLAAWAQGAGAPLGIWAFAYDHEGERVLKYRIEAGAVAEAELYLRDEQGNVLTELDWVDTGAGGYWARAKDHVYVGRDLMGSFDYTDGAPHIVTYARDHLGTQRAEVWALDAAATTDLWPYGAVANTKLLGDAPPLANGAHLFTGHERDFMGTEADPLQGLDYMHARYYFHELGRFLSVDPVEGSAGSSQSWNRYSYVAGNPLKFVDPKGKVGVLTGPEEEQRKTLAALKNTVPASLRIFVRTRTNKQGQTVIDTKKLRMAAGGSSGNFKALLAVAGSEKVFGINTSAGAVATPEGTEVLNGGSPRNGIFLDQGGLSPRKDMSFVFVGGDLSQRKKAVVLAHEMRHAALFALGKPFEHEMGLFEESPGVFNAYDPNGPVNRATAAAEVEAEANFDPFYPQD